MIADILVKIYLLSKVKVILMSIPYIGKNVFMSIFLACVIAFLIKLGLNNDDPINFITKVFKVIKFKGLIIITTVFTFLYGIGVMIPSKEELMVYYGAKQVTVQNYEKAKSEIIDFTKEIKKAITDKDK